jgi:CRP-like cAMP-binding protein
VISIAADEALVRKGEVGRDFYIIRTGVFRAVDGRRVLREMVPGDFFGEIALLRDTPRTATVIGISGGTVWRLSRQDFEELLGRYLELEEEFEKVATVRGHGMEGAA